MPDTTGYGMDAVAARSPKGGSSKKEKSSPDSGKPSEQYKQGKGPASHSDGNKASADAGNPSGNR